MADPSGTYDFLAKFTGATKLTIAVDPNTGNVQGTVGEGAETVAISGRWDDANSRISFNDAFAPGEVLFTHFFEGAVSWLQYDAVAGLAGTYHDLTLDLSGPSAVVRFVTDNGGWCASRTIIG